MTEPNVQTTGRFAMRYTCPKCGREQERDVPAELYRLVFPCDRQDCTGWLMVALNWAIAYGTEGEDWQELGLCPDCQEGRLLYQFDQDGTRSVRCTVCRYEGN